MDHYASDLDIEHRQECLATGPHPIQICDEQSGAIAYVFTDEMATALTTVLNAADTEETMTIARLTATC